MQILNLNDIKKRLAHKNIISYIEQGFVEYSKGNVILPPVGELLFNDPPGDVHIKYGYIKNDNYYIVKIASGFYNNLNIHLPSSNGVMLLFSNKTGELLTILLDEGYLTNIRTAVAGAIVAKYLAPQKVEKMGVIGTGIQARLQIQYLRQVRQCKEIIVFGRSSKKALKYKMDMEALGFTVAIADTLEEMTDECNLIITTTNSKTAILTAKHLHPGTHITAVGADTPDKQEIDEYVFKQSDLIVVDSVSQCIERGDTSHAIKKKIISKDSLTELGDVISGKVPGRTEESQITVADLTGLAVQDLQISKAVINETKDAKVYD